MSTEDEMVEAAAQGREDARKSQPRSNEFTPGTGEAREYQLAYTIEIRGGK